jgi:hypothetical protein
LTKLFSTTWEHGQRWFFDDPDGEYALTFEPSTDVLGRFEGSPGVNSDHFGRRFVDTGNGACYNESRTQYLYVTGDLHITRQAKTVSGKNDNGHL